jgi:hypothetical protein
MLLRLDGRTRLHSPTHAGNRFVRSVAVHTNTNGTNYGDIITVQYSVYENTNTTQATFIVPSPAQCSATRYVASSSSVFEAMCNKCTTSLLLLLTMRRHAADNNDGSRLHAAKIYTNGDFTRNRYPRLIYSTPKPYYLVTSNTSSPNVT